MTLGIISAILFVITAAKFITKRTSNKQLDRLMLKIHKISSFALFLVSIVHMILGWQLRYQRPVVMTVLGLVMTALIVLLILSHYYMRRKHKQWLLFHHIATILILICLCIHAIVGFTSLNAYQNKVAEITFMQDVKLEQLHDGEYVGSYDVGYIYAKVKVSIIDGKIQAVTLLEHRNEHGKPAEVIVDEFVKEQKFDVDAVSGATNSSKVIKKAVENALSSGN